jgi:hypothetical protein
LRVVLAQDFLVRQIPTAAVAVAVAVAEAVAAAEAVEDLDAHLPRTTC